jgi:hypothetical protein
MSGYIEDSVVFRGVAETQSFLQKPFSLASLAAKIRDVLGAAAVASA